MARRERVRDRVRGERMSENGRERERDERMRENGRETGGKR